MQNRYNIIHHIKIDTDIRIRILSEKQPLPDAKPVAPTLEDAYLWLLGDFAGEISR
jgi:hypothetical protein